MKTGANQELMLIDYEYSGWNPMAMDLANYLNETMLDNAHPEGDGIKPYLANCMEKHELVRMATRYLECYHKHLNSEEDLQVFVNRELPLLINDVYDCASLNNFFWGLWALALLTPEPTSCAVDGLMNYAFADARLQMYQQVQKLKA